MALDALRTDPRITMYLMATWGRAPDVKVADPPAGSCEAWGGSLKIRKAPSSPQGRGRISDSRNMTPTGKGTHPRGHAPCQPRSRTHTGRPRTAPPWNHNCGGCKNKTEGAAAVFILAPTVDVLVTPFETVVIAPGRVLAGASKQTSDIQ